MSKEPYISLLWQVRSNYINVPHALTNFKNVASVSTSENLVTKKLGLRPVRIKTLHLNLKGQKSFKSKYKTSPSIFFHFKARTTPHLRSYRERAPKSISIHDVAIQANTEVIAS